MSLIGEVQGDFRYPEKPGNLVLGPKSNQQALQALARRGQVQGAHLWPQLGHAGALSHLPISRPKGPSALNVDGFKCEGMLAMDFCLASSCRHYLTIGLINLEVQLKPDLTLCIK